MLQTGGSVGPLGEEHADALERATADHWRGWLARSTYSGRWRETVHRSALALKLLSYQPTGAMVAAPTTSLPERLGGPRNWDYRYAWVRDFAFSLYALLRLGFTDEAQDVARGLTSLGELSPHPASTSPLPPVLYGVDQDADTTEQTLDHLSGYQNSAPVRIGNAAADQLQLDIYGGLLDSLYISEQLAQPAAASLRRLARGDSHRRLGVRALAGARRRHLGGPQRSPAVHLLAADVLGRARSRDPHRRAPRPAGAARAMDHPTRRHLPVDHGPRLEPTAPGVRAVRGLRRARRVAAAHAARAFHRADRPALALDPRRHRPRARLRQPRLPLRPRAAPDGLDGGEGTFSMCTFWYVECLARAGRLEEAQLTFEKMLTYANHLGLYSEEIGASGELLGNFPQAFTHLAMISAAVNLDRQLSRQATRPTRT